MAIIMNMSGYEVEREDAEMEYGEEILNAGWNPQLALVGECPTARDGGHVALPAALANVDIDAFLSKMYAAQR